MQTELCREVEHLLKDWKNHGYCYICHEHVKYYEYDIACKHIICIPVYLGEDRSTECGNQGRIKSLIDDIDPVCSLSYEKHRCLYNDKQVKESETA